MIPHPRPANSLLGIALPHTSSIFNLSAIAFYLPSEDNHVILFLRQHPFMVLVFFAEDIDIASTNISIWWNIYGDCHEYLIGCVNIFILPFSSTQGLLIILVRDNFLLILTSAVHWDLIRNEQEHFLTKQSNFILFIETVGFWRPKIAQRLTIDHRLLQWSVNGLPSFLPQGSCSCTCTARLRVVPCALPSCLVLLEAFSFLLWIQNGHALLCEMSWLRSITKLSYLPRCIHSKTMALFPQLYLPKTFYRNCKTKCKVFSRFNYNISCQT